jgi:ElaB/YqjD/DUF883 family membrane-anchored ribosome-binding protein
MALNIQERQPTLDDVVGGVSRIKAMVTEAVEDGVKTALRTVKQGKDVAEDKIHDARYAIKRNPFRAIGIVFAAGVAVGSLATWMSSRRG